MTDATKTAKTKTRTAATYTTTGPVRGCCGHDHRSIRTAHACASRDQSQCRRSGGYSDRSIVRRDGGALTDLEVNKIEFWEVAGR
jgi:hypothetical protein